MGIVTYRAKVYDLDGVLKRTLTEAVEQRFTIPLNANDQHSFSLYLDSDDAKSGEIRPLDRVVKVWRDINDPVSGETFTQPAATPFFSGFVTQTIKQGQAGQMSVVCQAPFWRLQARFHILNHYLVKDYVGSDANEDGLDWDQSALMWKLISLVNGAFPGGAGHTGIVKPTVGPPYWPKTIVVAPYRVPKGSNTYQHIFEDLMQRVAHADITPEYINDGSWHQMYFKTAARRGSDKSGTVKYNWCTQAADPTKKNNADDMTESYEIAVPTDTTGFANYVWCVGQGGVNKSVGLAQDEAATAYGWDNVGIYMKLLEQQQVFKVAAMRKIAEADLAKAHIPQKTYTVVPSPLIPPYYGLDYQVGDTIELNANKGAMVFSGVKQRVYAANLAMSENCVETVALTLGPDFTA